jgi:xanthine dehydrogenase YagS FAD-binding subunit
MKKFTYINATTVDQAVSALATHGEAANILAGGTDLLGELHHRVRPVQPEVIINLKNITELDGITEDGGGLAIGAMTRLDDIAFSSQVLSKYPVLAQAARKVASWQIRNQGTIGGNICQEVRCMYYRVTWNKFHCLRKGGAICNALAGDNRFHQSIFGSTLGCVAAHPSDIAPALVALGADIHTSKREIAAEDFFDGFTKTVLDTDEIVTEIHLAAPPSSSKQVFVKASIRRAVDFALANVAVVLEPASGSITSASVVFNAVATTPMRSTGAEDVLVGSTISESVAQSAADAAAEGTTPLPLNKYKIELMKGVLKKALLS